MGATADKDKRRVYMLHNFGLPFLTLDLGDVTREGVYCHQGVDARDFWAGTGESANIM